MQMRMMISLQWVSLAVYGPHWVCMDEHAVA